MEMWLGVNENESFSCSFFSQNELLVDLAGEMWLIGSMYPPLISTSCFIALYMERWKYLPYGVLNIIKKINHPIRY